MLFFFSFYFQIILEWFLKDHVTQKTKVMAAEKSDLPTDYI